MQPNDPDDRAFVLSGWSASLRMSRDIPFVPMDSYAAIMRPVISRAVDRAIVLVAAGAVLQGFIAFEPTDYVLYVYVAQPFRRNGIARDMFLAADIDPASRFSYACRTKMSWECRHAMPRAVYDPYRARFPLQLENHEQRNAK